MKSANIFASSLWIVILGLIGPAAMVRAEDDLPKRLSFDRYQQMLVHSPFAVATAAAPVVVAPDAFKGLYVANAAHMPEGDLVTIMSTDDKNFKEYVSTKQPNEHGYAVASIEWSDRPGATKVTISKDGKFGTLTFNQALLVGGPAPLPGQAAYQPPVQQPQILPAISPAGAPRPAPARVPPLPNTTPHTRGVIQRNPAAATPRQVIPEE
jgi:hypothetical protein